MRKYADPKPGDTFGKWTVLRQVERPVWCPRGRGVYFEARCECNTVRVHNGYQLAAGKTKSCGCATAWLPNPVWRKA